MIQFLFRIFIYKITFLQTQLVYDMRDTTQLIFEAKLISNTCPLMFSVYVFYLMHIAK